MSGMHIKGEKIKVAVKCSRLSHGGKTGHFIWWKERERL